MNIVVDLVGQLRCSLGRHSWQHEPAQHVNGMVYGPYKTCRRCMKSHVVLPDLPAGHPDTATIAFTPAQIRVLKALDASLTEEPR